MKEYENLIRHAFAALEHAYAPYSGFRVGACLEMKDGNFVCGANIENASYGLSNCAERSALFSAYSQGYRKKDIAAMAVVTKAEQLTTPCGACRQVICELLDEAAPIVLSNGKEMRVTNIKELLPDSFGEADLC